MNVTAGSLREGIWLARGTRGIGEAHIGMSTDNDMAIGGYPEHAAARRI
jgi:hypothetical protein